MILIIGLGNPGKKYALTRHNIGYLVLDELGALLDFSKFKKEERFLSALSFGSVGGNKVILAKPQTFMNESGKAVSLLVNYYKAKPEEIAIVRDDLDLDFGTYREKYDSASGGHNGVNSIIECLKSKRFLQVKIGVKNSLRDKIDAADFVLSNFSKDELKRLEKLIPEYAMNIERTISQTRLLVNTNNQAPLAQGRSASGGK